MLDRMSANDRSKLGRSESGASLTTSVAQNNTQIDQIKIERLITAFNMM